DRSLILGRAAATGGFGPRRRIDRRGQLIPDFDFVAVGIRREEVWLTRHEFPLLSDRAPGFLHRAGRRADVFGLLQPESKMGDAAGLAGVPRALLQHDDVARPGRLQLREAVLPVHLHRAEDLGVEPGGAVDVPHRQRDVRQAVGLDHPLYITRQILPSVSSVMSSEPSGPIARPPGRASACPGFISGVLPAKPSANTSCLPDGLSPENGTKVTL